MITFVTCWDNSFDPGGLALVHSIRRFYSPADAEIIALVNERPNADGLIRHLVEKMKVEVRQVNGVSMLRAKAYVTGYALLYHERANHSRPDNVLHIDADAFLLAPVDDIFKEMAEDSVLAFPDSCGLGTPEYELTCDRPDPAKIPLAFPGFNHELYRCNAGIVFYRNGQHVQEFARRFMDRISCNWVWALNRNDQNIWRSLLADHALMHGLTFRQHDDGWHWNPMGTAEELREEKGMWYNTRDGKRQYLWHGVGERKPWRDKVSKSVKEAFEWASQD